jgi:ABC-2 type transport system permease protein
MNITNVKAIFKRELKNYFSTPVAAVFLVIFLMMSSALTFYLGQFFERGQADLQSFFAFHPWMYLFLIPAISMRLWSEERKTGTIELLMTLPISISEAVIGKYLAAWGFTSIALLLTFPIWITVNYLGDPDNLVILAGYIGSLLMAGAFLAVGSCISAISKNQVIAFVITVVVCFGFIFSGFPLVLDFFQGWLPQIIVDAISSLSFLTHFNDIQRGVIDLRDIIFFSSFIICWLFANVILVEMKKAD